MENFQAAVYILSLQVKTSIRNQHVYITITLFIPHEFEVLNTYMLTSKMNWTMAQFHNETVMYDTYPHSN